ncbi:hypothetical protein ABLA30_07060 [Xenorhabdus nematophila]|uniref:hypothetical protein n=1 Tax=Xenorhabdus nematophila TaxID=628 RepID=UPI0032B852E0
MILPENIFNEVVQSDIDPHITRVKTLVLERSPAEICQLVADSVSVHDLVMVLGHFNALKDRRDKADNEYANGDFSKPIENIKIALAILSYPSKKEDPQEEKQGATLN